MFSTPAITMAGMQGGAPTFSPWPMPGPNYSMAPPMAPHPVAMTPDSFNQPSGASWESDVPVMANARAAFSDHNKGLEAGDYIWTLAPVPGSVEERRLFQEGRVRPFNIAMANLWLREKCKEANDWVAKNLTSDPLATACEFEFERARHDPNSTIGRRSEEVRALLAYRTSAGVRSRFVQLGANMTQPNMVTSTNLELGGSLSASQNDTQVAWCVAGSAQTRNIWGLSAIVGRHLWVLIKRTEDGVFQLEPYMHDGLSDLLPPGAGMYRGANGDFERAAYYYIGVVSVRGRVTVRDRLAVEAAWKPKTLATAHSAANMLELINVTVAPSHHGLYMFHLY